MIHDKNYVFMMYTQKNRYMCVHFDTEIQVQVPHM